MRSRAPLSFVTSRVSWYWANDPAIWRIMTLEGSVVSLRSDMIRCRFGGVWTSRDTCKRARAYRLARLVNG
jgi:hypothetical protein